MKHLLSLSLVFLFLNLSAQSKWSIGVITGIDQADVVRTEDYLESLKPIISLRYGITLDYKINEKLTLSSGLGLNAQGEQSAISDLRWGSEHDGMGGFTNDPNLSQSGKFRYSERFLEIPLHLKVNLSKSKWIWFLEGGVSPNLYLNSRTKSTVDNIGSISQVSSERGQFRKITGSVDFGFGVEKSVGDRLNLSFQPMFRYYPLSMGTSEEYLFKSHYYNFGVELGASYTLGK